MFHFKLIRLSLLAMAMLSSRCYAQDQVFSVTLKETNVNELRSSGQLQSTVRTENVGRIGSVLLQLDGARSGPPVEQDPGFAIDGSKITLVVDEKMLTILKTQPIKLVLPKSAAEFRTLTMLYTESTGTVKPPLQPILDTAGKKLDVIFLTLDTNQVLAGGLEGVKSLEMATQLGSVKVALSKVAGIRFNSQANRDAVVFLKNGDSITGQLAAKELLLMTEWGSAQIDIASLQSLTITPESRFSNQETDFGSRWNLELGDSIAPDSLLAPESPEDEDADAESDAAPGAPTEKKESVIELD